MTIEKLKVFVEIAKRRKEQIDYHTEQAEYYERLYYLPTNSENEADIVLNDFAKEQILYHNQHKEMLSKTQTKAIQKILKELNVTKEDIKNLFEL